MTSRPMWNGSAASSVRDHRQVRDAFGAFPTGVTVVTVGGARPHGMTASSFTSVSLQPPRVLVCIDHSTTMHRHLLGADCFAVSVLDEDQEHLARYFADSSRPQGADQFDWAMWTVGQRSGSPILDQASAVFECRREAAHDAGDHSIVVGQVLSMTCGPDRSPLLFAHGQLSPWQRRTVIETLDEESA